MRGILKFVIGLPGVLLDILGVIGLLDDTEKLDGTLNIFKGWFDSPWVYGSALVVGTIMLVLAFGTFYAEHIIAKAGGETHREFPARLKHWDHVREFTVWQVAWLWNDLEPQPSDQNTEGTPAYPTFRMLKEDLNRGMIPGAKSQNGSWIWATLDRQKLINYAFAKERRPKFLFKNQRYPYPISAAIRLLSGEIPWKSQDHYESFDSFRHRYAMAAQEIGCERPYEDSWPFIQHWFENGEWEAIGRRKKGDNFYHYEKIPPWKWEHIQTGFKKFRWADEEYAEVLVRQANTEHKYC